MTGTLPPAVAGQLIGKHLRKKKKKKDCDTEMAAKVASRVIAARCNVIRLSRRIGQVIEFKSFADVDLTNWADVHGYVDSNGRNRKGIIHQVVNHAEVGGRVAADIADAIQRRRSMAESARVGQFKITENSPNTARITVGPDKRERRKKYAWERVGNQRIIAGAVLSGVVVGGAALHKRIVNRLKNPPDLKVVPEADKVAKFPMTGTDGPGWDRSPKVAAPGRAVVKGEMLRTRPAIQEELRAALRKIKIKKV